MEPVAHRELLRFGPFELDPVREELRRGGLVVRVPRQPLRILILLVRRTGEVVSRDEIHAAIWGDETYVDFEHGINSAIRQIRFALGDHAETPRYVRTLPRRGYSFIASVEHVARSEEPVVESVVKPAARRMPARITAIAASAIVTITLVVALIAESRRSDHKTPSSGKTFSVQPFRRLGPVIVGVDERSFTEELRATMGRLPRAHVSLVQPPARADVMVNGTIQQSEDGIRVIVTMSDAKTQAQIWSETYMRPAARREGMAVAVAHQVMREVARRFLPPPRREPLLRTTKVSVKAIGLYKRARMLHSRSQAYDWMRTKELYEAAIREEPRFAEAWSGLSDVWIMQALMFTSSDSARAAAQAADAARRAIALQPDNAEAHSTLALLSSQRDFNLAAAEDALRRAVSADPEYVDARLNLAMVLTMRGQVDESLREFELTQQLDPAGLDLVPTEPFLYLQARRYDDARARYRELLAVNPQSQAAVWGLLFTYVAQKNWAEALTLAASIRQDKIDDVPRTEAGFQKFYGGLETYMQNGREQNRFNDYFLATYYAQIGKRDRAFEVLSRAIDTRVPVVSYIMVDPRLDSLRGDPRFNALVARLELGRPPAGP